MLVRARARPACLSQTGAERREDTVFARTLSQALKFPEQGMASVLSGWPAPVTDAIRATTLQMRKQRHGWRGLVPGHTGSLIQSGRVGQ